MQLTGSCLSRQQAQKDQVGPKNLQHPHHGGFRAQFSESQRSGPEVLLGEIHSMIPEKCT